MAVREGGRRAGVAAHVFKLTREPITAFSAAAVALGAPASVPITLLSGRSSPRFPLPRRALPGGRSYHELRILLYSACNTRVYHIILPGRRALLARPSHSL